MQKVIATVKEVVKGIPMGVLMLLAVVGSIKGAAWLMNKGKPGLGDKFKKAADVNA